MPSPILSSHWVLGVTHKPKSKTLCLYSLYFLFGFGDEFPWNQINGMPQNLSSGPGLPQQQDCFRYPVSTAKQNHQMIRNSTVRNSTIHTLQESKRASSTILYIIYSQGSVHNSLSHTTQSKWLSLTTDKQNGESLHKGTVFDHRKKWSMDACSIIKPWKHFPIRKKPIMKGHPLNISIWTSRPQEASLHPGLPMLPG